MISLSTIFLEHNLPGLGSHLVLCGSHAGCRIVIASIVLIDYQKPLIFT